jgi:hypothetical protein
MPCPRFTVRWLMVAVAIVALLFVAWLWAEKMIRPTASDPDASAPRFPKALPKLTKQDAITIARRTASSHGIDLRRYQERSVVFEVPYWYLDYEMSAMPAGGYFTIKIDDGTSRVELFRGH